MLLLQMLLIIAKIVEIATISSILIISAVIIWDLTENFRIEQRKLRQIKRDEIEFLRQQRVLQEREIRRNTRSEEIRERAKEQLRIWKEMEANRKFFDDPAQKEFHSNFDKSGRLIYDDWLPPTEESRYYLEQMRQKDDDITIKTYEGAL